MKKILSRCQNKKKYIGLLLVSPIVLSNTSFADYIPTSWSSYLIYGQNNSSSLYCLESPEKEDIGITNPQASFYYSGSFDIGKTASDLGVEGNLSGASIIFSTDLAANYINSIQSTQNSMNASYTYLYNANIYTKNQAKDFSPQILNIINSYNWGEEDQNKFIALCGDGYVKTYSGGAVLQANLVFTFSSTIEKKDFTAKIGGKITGSSAGINAALEAFYSTENTDQNSSVKIMAIQRGGEPSQLASIFSNQNSFNLNKYLLDENSKSSEVDISCPLPKDSQSGEVNPSGYQACYNQFEKIVNYSAQMSNQIYSTADPSKIDYDKLMHSQPQIQPYDVFISQNGGVPLSHNSEDDLRKTLALNLSNDIAYDNKLYNMALIYKSLGVLNLDTAINQLGQYLDHVKSNYSSINFSCLQGYAYNLDQINNCNQVIIDEQVLEPAGIISDLSVLYGESFRAELPLPDLENNSIDTIQNCYFIPKQYGSSNYLMYCDSYPQGISNVSVTFDYNSGQDEINNLDLSYSVGDVSYQFGACYKDGSGLCSTAMDLLMSSYVLGETQFTPSGSQQTYYTRNGQQVNYAFNMYNSLINYLAG